MPGLIRVAAALVAFTILLTVPAAAQIARVNGVVRSVTGEPLRGALVTADSGTGIVTAATDDNGRFTIVGMRSGRWKFEVQAPGYLTESGEIQVRSIGPQNTPITIALRRSGLVYSGPLADVAGRDLQPQLSAADALFEQQRWEEALVAYRAILTRAPSLTAVGLQIATVYRHQKNFPAAAEAYQTVLKTEPDNSQALVGLSAVNLERGDAQAAEQVLMAAAATPTAGREVFFGLGELHASQGHAPQAIEWYQKAAGADPSWGKPRYKLGELAMTNGDVASGTRYLEEVLAVDPLSPEATLAKTALDRLNNK
jgi:Tfp pilus assembly protein PilF